MKKLLLLLANLLYLSPLISQEIATQGLFSQIAGYARPSLKSDFVTNNQLFTIGALAASTVALNGWMKYRNYKNDMDTYTIRSNALTAKKKRLFALQNHQGDIGIDLDTQSQAYSKLSVTIEQCKARYDRHPRISSISDELKALMFTNRDHAFALYQNQDEPGLKTHIASLSQQINVLEKDIFKQEQLAWRNLDLAYSKALLKALDLPTLKTQISTLEAEVKDLDKKLPAFPHYPIRQVAAGVAAPVALVAGYGLFKYWDKLPRLFS